MSNQDSEGFHTDSWASTGEQRDAGVQPWMNRHEAEWAVSNHREEQFRNTYGQPPGGGFTPAPPVTIYSGGGGAGLSRRGKRFVLAVMALGVLALAGPNLWKWLQGAIWDFEHGLGRLPRIMGASWAMPRIPLPPLEAFQGIHPAVRPDLEMPKDMRAFVHAHKREPASLEHLEHHASPAQLHAEAVAYRCVQDDAACDEKLSGISKAELDRLDAEPAPKRAYFQAIDRIRAGRNLATDFLVHASRNGDAPACLALWQWVSRGMMLDGSASYVMQDSGKSAFKTCLARGKGKALQNPDVAALQHTLSSFPATYFLQDKE